MVNSRSNCVALASCLTLAYFCSSSTATLADEMNADEKPGSAPAATDGGQQSAPANASPNIPAVSIPYKDHSLENSSSASSSGSASAQATEATTSIDSQSAGTSITGTSDSGISGANASRANASRANASSANASSAGTSGDNSGVGSVTSAVSSQGEKKAPMLQGGVSGTAVRIEDGLTRINLGDQAAQQSCESIMREATRKDTIIMRGPNYIGNGIVIPALGGQGGVMQMGEMPIRRDRLNRYLSQSEQNISAAQTYIDGLIIPAENSAATTAYTSLRSSMAVAQEHLAQLKELSAQKRLMNKPIGREALAIFDAITEVEKSRSELAKLLFSTSDGAPGETTSASDCQDEKK